MHSSQERESFKVMVAACTVVILLMLLVHVFGSYMEARSYNRVTGNNVSTWDAMWIDLRVQDQPSSK